MIIPMARIRVLGPRDDLDSTLAALQDVEVLHLAEVAAQPGIRRARLDARRERRRRQLLRVLGDVSAVLHGDDASGGRGAREPPSTAVLATWACEANRVRREVQRLSARERALEEEQALVSRYRGFLTAVHPMVRRIALTPRLTSRIVVVPAAMRGTIDTLAALLRGEIGEEFAIDMRSLADGDLAVLLALPRDFSERLDARLADARVPEVTLPEVYRGLPLEQAIPRMIARGSEIAQLLTDGRREREERVNASRAALRQARQAIHDWLSETDAHEKCAVTQHAFAIEGWIPEHRTAALVRYLTRASGPDVTVETIAREAWSADDAPVMLSNPRFFRPFEALIALMPLPAYGSIDPTPYVAVFFPMIFGMMLGDVGYGLLLAVLAFVLHRRSTVGSVQRTLAEVAGPCAAFAIIFGVLFGEYFGDAAHRLFGLEAVLFDRAHAVLAALAVAIGLGVVHVVLGLILGAVSAVRHEPRHAVGKGVSAVMVLLVVGALLAAFDVLPEGLFTPAVIALLIAFPVLIATEGLIAPVEFLATLGNVLSYARIMAVGTASVMLAVVANQMIGTLGSTAVGLVFALLFHLVNFAIGLFTPAIHALRLHYVEFFGKFYSPGGHSYAPFGRWTPSPGQ
ncbi:MAG: V-type ATPase 116kDa subunit family protein [Gemmatimonas sp.]